MTDQKRILFVDDEPKILDGLRRMLRPMRRDWDMAFVESGPAALDLLAGETFEVVVTDMRMPGMDGGQLLRRVMEHYPQTIRIVLSGQADREAILGGVGPIHQYLSKPCDAETLKASLTRACALGELLADESLKQYISQLETLPSLPSLYDEVVSELQSPTASEKMLGQIISKDIGMSAKVLQLVSSAFFGIRSHIPHPAQAVILLGLDTVKILGLSAQVFSRFTPVQTENLPFPATFWSHSVNVARMAQQIVKAEGAEQRLVDYAFIAGLLHDVGKLVLATYSPRKYEYVLVQALQENIEVRAAEHRIFGPASHAEVGAYLLGLWGLPEFITNTILFHHTPDQYPQQGCPVLTAVHVANVLENSLLSTQALSKSPELNLDYLAHLGLAERLPVWQDLCLEAVQEADFV